MPTYTVRRSTLRHDGEDYSEGDSVKMDADTARSLLALGAIEEQEEAGDQDTDDEVPTPSEDLKELVGTKQANRLAESGITTIEEALAFEGDLTELEGVGPATAEDLIAFAE